MLANRRNRLKRAGEGNLLMSFGVLVSLAFA